MSFKKIGSRYDKDLKEWLEQFEADRMSDVSALPPANPGSTCHVKETGDTLILAYNGVWGGPNQPFGYSTTTVKEVLAECQPVFNNTLQGGLIGHGQEMVLTVGETYIVTMDGTEYTTLPAVDMTTMDDERMWVGLVNEGTNLDTGEGLVFMVVSFVPEFAAGVHCPGVVRTKDGSVPATISIRQEVTEVKKISGKYVEGMGYVETSEFTVIPEQTITVSADAHVNVSAEHAVSAGDHVTVIWDGVSFERVAAEIKGVACVGNAAFGGMGEDTGEPFLIGFRGATAMVFVETDGAVSVGVTYYSETIHPIDPRFLPSGGGATLYGNNDDLYLYHDADFSKKVSREELLAMLNGVVYIRADDSSVRGYLYNVSDYIDNNEDGVVLSIIKSIGSSLSKKSFYTKEFVAAGPQ